MKTTANNYGKQGSDFMPIELSEEFRIRLKARLEGGSYQSEEEVLREALDALDQVEADRVARWHEGNAIAMQQSQQGLSKPLDEQKVLARLRARLAKEGIL